jgi:hypothetical protein
MIYDLERLKPVDWDMGLHEVDNHKNLGEMSNRNILSPVLVGNLLKPEAEEKVSKSRGDTEEIDFEVSSLMEAFDDDIHRIFLLEYVDEERLHS